MKIYIAGAIASPVPAQGHNKSPLNERGMLCREEKEILFREAQKFLEILNHTAVVPLDIPACLEPGFCGDRVDPEDSESHSFGCYMKYDLVEMLKCDGVMALSNYQFSKGARIEVDLAIKLDIPVWVWDGYGYKFINTDIRLAGWADVRSPGVF